jgi:methylenetetrahydrofolate dehydrogenase (NADP+)/methenyltetrahydrofolate cyclohydrolase
MLLPASAALAAALIWLRRARRARARPPCAVLLGNVLARELWSELNDELTQLRAEFQLGADAPHLVILTATELARHYAARERSVIVREMPGLRVSERQLPPSIRTETLVALVRQYNADPRVQAVNIQLPLPMAVDAPRVFAALCAEKDAQGLGALNYRELCLKLGRPLAVPPIAAATIEALQRSGIQIQGRRAVVIGRSSTVGGPIAQLLLRYNATVTVCHSYTPDLRAIVRRAHIVVSSANIPNSLPGECGLLRGALCRVCSPSRGGCGGAVAGGRGGGDRGRRRRGKNVVGEEEAAGGRGCCGTLGLRRRGGGSSSWAFLVLFSFFLLVTPLCPTGS